MPTQATGKPCRRAASAKRIGNRPLPARRPIGATLTPVVGRFVARSGTGGSPSYMFLDFEFEISNSGHIVRRSISRRIILGVGAGRQGGRQEGDPRGKLAELAVHLGELGDHLENPPLIADRNG